MGHTRLGTIPSTRKWTTVVATVTTGASIGRGITPEEVKSIASKTLDAAQAGIDWAIGDTGVRYSFYLLTRLVLSAREKNWKEELEKLGIGLSADATIFELTAEIQKNIDDYLMHYGRTTDVSEIAQQAAGEAIAALAGPRSVTLFGSGRDELQSAIRELSTKKGFARLGQTFFGRFMARFLNFYLSRIMAAQIGSDRFQQIGELSRFNEVLQSHCEQSARIVHDFCGEWYSKTEFQKGINLENTTGFMAVALKKLQLELKRQEVES